MYRKVVYQAWSNGIKEWKCQCRSECSQRKITCWFWISKRKITVSNQRVSAKYTCNWCYGTMRSRISPDIFEYDIWNQVTIKDVCCNMKFSDSHGNDHRKMNIELFSNCCRSVQTSCLVCSRPKNWVEKNEILIMLGCTSIVWQNRNVSSASSSLTKHHFWIFFHSWLIGATKKVQSRSLNLLFLAETK